MTRPAIDATWRERWSAALTASTVPGHEAGNACWDGAVVVAHSTAVSSYARVGADANYPISGDDLALARAGRIEYTDLIPSAP